MEVVQARLQRPDCQRGFLLDGVPRTVNQAEMLERILKEQGTPLTGVVQLMVPENVLLERIRHRGGNGSGARADDTAEVAAHRLQVYWTQTAPVANYYRERGALREINGVGTVEEVSERIFAVLSSERP